MQDDTLRSLLQEVRSDVKSILQTQAKHGERLDNVIRKIDDHVKDDELKHTRMDERLDNVENWRSRVIGMFVVAGAALGFLGGFAKDAIAAVLFGR